MTEKARRIGVQGRKRTHSHDKYLLRSYDMSRIVLGTEDIESKENRQNLCPYKTYLLLKEDNI